MAAPTYDYSQYATPAADPYAATYGAQAAAAYYPAPGAYAAPATAAYAVPPPSGYEELRTIFITGFPGDVKERELNNLLRFLPGYEASQMNWKNGQAQGFALFTNGSAARAACDAITQLCFDDTAVLRCEMARKNMYIKDDPNVKRPRTGAGGYTGGVSTYPAPVAAPAATTAAAYPVRPVGYAPISNTGDNPPCNTLFIGNLGDTVSETELRGLFAHQPGFRQLKLVRGGKNTSCFVEFDDVPTAMAVHQSQQGAILTSSDRGGIRIQYSKNPFGKKRDASGVMIDTIQRQPDYSASAAPGVPGLDPSA